MSTHNRALMELGRAARKRLRLPPSPLSPSTPLQLVQSSILFRHGDRSPSFNIFEPDVVQASHEAFAWAAELPSDATLAELESFAPTRRVQVSPDGSLSLSSTTERPRDAELGSFGRLSRVGVAQAHDLGSWLSGLYAPTPNSTVHVTSSNYARTIATAQATVKSFLPGDAPKGAVQVRVHDPKSEYLNVYPFFTSLQQRMLELTKQGWFQDFDQTVVAERQKLESLLPTFSFHLRKFSWLTCQDHFRCRELRRERHGKGGGGGGADVLASRASPKKLKQKILPRTYSTVDGKAWKDSWLHVETLKQLRATFNETDHNQNGMLSKKELEIIVHKMLPSSIMGGQDIDVLYSALVRGEEEDGVSWDDFLQLVGNGLPSLSCKQSEKELWSLRPIVEEYTIKRFGMWYGDLGVRSMATGGLVRALERCQDDVVGLASGSVGVGSSVGVGVGSGSCHYNFLCGHDVTILPLLHLLGARREANQWPGYTCVLLLELMVDETDGEYYVRALWHPGRSNVGRDGDDEYCRPLLLQQDEEGNGKEMVSLNDFRTMTKETIEHWCEWKQNGR